MKETQSTQQFVEIEDVKDGVIFLKNGSLRQLLIVSGVNFDLKSEAEQDLITFTYQNFLNSLDFSVQIFIHSRRVNIESYLQKLRERQNQEDNELLKNQISEYTEFIKAFVSQNAIMDKKFFVAVPYDPIQLPSAAKGLFSFFKKKNKAAPEKNTTENIQQNIQQLNQRLDQVILGLQQIGLRVVPLDTEETLELIYNLYNP